MKPAIISPSLLGYADDISAAKRNIDELLGYGPGDYPGGIKELHIDIMRDPFIPGKDAFGRNSIVQVIRNYEGSAALDFHLMVREPAEVIDLIDSNLSETFRARPDINITLHAEAYRRGPAPFLDKGFDLRHPRGKDAVMRDISEEMYGKSHAAICEALRAIKSRGYNAGIALEPGTALDNITEEIASATDRILLMSVVSGAGGQGFIDSVYGKIASARERFGNHIIQVDGGIKDHNVRRVVDAGADNVVIGSYITAAEVQLYPVARVTCELDGVICFHGADVQLGTHKDKTVVVGCDHRGLAHKDMIRKHLEQQGYDVINLPAYSADRCDYPVISHDIGKHVAMDKYNRVGIGICGSGIGIGMVAGKNRGVYCGKVNHVEGASNTRQHNNANMISIPGDEVSVDDACRIVDAFMETPHGRDPVNEWSYIHRAAQTVRLEAEIFDMYCDDSSCEETV